MELPSFLPSRPDIWFIQVETFFSLNHITSDEMKWNYVVTSLDHEAVQSVSDIILKPPTENGYNLLKESLLKDVRNMKLKQLNVIELGDKKPSFLLQLMEDLTRDMIKEDLLRSLWIQRLPVAAQKMLTNCKEMSLKELGRMADRLLLDVGIPNNGKPMLSKNENMKEQMAKLESSVKSLQIDVAGCVGGVHKINPTIRSRSFSRLCKRSRSPDRSKLFDCPKSHECFYHERYKEKAHRCVPPCNYPGKKPGEMTQLSLEKTENVTMKI